MSDYINKIREISKTLLEAETVDRVIGYQAGNLPMTSQPCVVRQPADVDRLIWDSHCAVNLVTYLTNQTDKIGIIAKGCDSRSLVTQIKENKINREQLTIIGIPCEGMIDRRKAEQAVDFEISEVQETADTITIKGISEEKQFARSEMLQANCQICAHPNPVIYDELVSDPVEVDADLDRFEKIRAVEDKSPEEKWAYFDGLFSDCIRCYACRNVCPLCYCPTCFVDESQPQWVGKSNDVVDTKVFNILRAFHCAGRCSDCGSCERVCPMGISMRTLTQKLEKDCLEFFGWESGLKLDEKSPLDTFNPEDPDKFIR